MQDKLLEQSLNAKAELKIMKEHSLVAKNNEGIWSQMCNFMIWCPNGWGRYWLGNRPKRLVIGDLLFRFIWAWRCGLGLLSNRKIDRRHLNGAKKLKGFTSLSEVGLETVYPLMEAIWNISLSLRNQRPRLVTCVGGIQIYLCSSSPRIFNPRENIKKKKKGNNSVKFVEANTKSLCSNISATGHMGFP